MASIYDLINKKVAGVGYTPEEKAAQARGQQTQSQEPKRLVSDPKAKSVFDAFAKMQGPTRSGAPLAANPLIGKTPERDIEQERTQWRPSLLDNLRNTKSTATNPFAIRDDEVSPELNRPLPDITPDIREMADPLKSKPLDTKVVTPEYIKNVSLSDGDLGYRLSNRYLSEYALNQTPKHDETTLEELRLISRKGAPAEKQIGLENIFGFVTEAFRLPVELGGSLVLDEAARRNIDVDSLPPYYQQLAKGDYNPMGKFGSPLLNVSQFLTPADQQPDPIPANNARYMAIVNAYKEAGKRNETLKKTFTFSDFVNTILSAPGVYTANEKGLDVSTALMDTPRGVVPVTQNILQTGEMAGLIPARDAAQFLTNLMDQGVTIDDEDARTYRTGWSPEQYQKYDAQLKTRGTSLGQMMLQNGLTWPELQDTLQLMNFNGQAQQDIATSLGYDVSGIEDQPIKQKKIVSAGSGGVEYADDVVGSVRVFNVNNPEKRVTYQDLVERADVDLGVLGLTETKTIADLVATRYAMAKVGQNKTAGFMDFVGSMFLDPFNFGKLQLVWKPMGWAFEGGAKAAKFGAKTLIKGGAMALDLPLGAAATGAKALANKFGETAFKLESPLGLKTPLGRLLLDGGEQSAKMTGSDWSMASDFISWVGRETAESASWKEGNLVFFGFQSAFGKAVKDGEDSIAAITDTLPKLQQAARSGDGSLFKYGVNPGAAHYVSKALNSSRDNLVRISVDENAREHFIKNFSTVFQDFTEDDQAIVRKMLDKGDTAGLMQYSVQRRIQDLVNAGVEQGKARGGINLNDVLNQFSAAYKNGVRVLTEVQLGTFGEKEATGAIKAANNVSETARRVWIGALLSARPGYNVINYLDNAARLAANGYNPVMSAHDQASKVSAIIGSSQLRSELGIETSTMLETVQDILRLPQSALDAATAIKSKIGVATDDEIDALVKALKKSNTGLPKEASEALKDRTNELVASISEFRANAKNIRAVKIAASKIEGSVFERQVGMGDDIFKPAVKILKGIPKETWGKLREYETIITKGGNLPKQVWDDWIGLGRAVHTEIEAAAKMRVYGTEFLERYQKYLNQLDLSDVPELGDPQLQHELNAAMREAMTNPAKFNTAKDVLNRAVEQKSTSDATRNWLVSFLPAMPDGTRPYLEPLTEKMTKWLNLELGRDPNILKDPNKVLEAMERGRKFAEERVQLEHAEPQLTSMVDRVGRPSTKTPPLIGNEISNGGLHTLNPKEAIVRAERTADRLQSINDRILQNYVDVQHTNYNAAIDTIQMSVPGRAHRYDLMRDSFAEKFAGDAKYNGEDVRLINAIKSSKGEPQMVIIGFADDTTKSVLAKDVVVEGRQKVYYDLYLNWDKTKPSGPGLLEKSGIYVTPGKGKVELYGATGKMGTVPPDVARAYTKRVEQDILAKGGEIPAQYKLGTLKSAATYNLRYETEQDVVNAFRTGSGLSITHQGDADVIAGLNRIADNHVAAARLADATTLDELKNVTVGGKSVAEYMRKVNLDPTSTDDIRTAMRQILELTDERVSILIERGPKNKQNLSNLVGKAGLLDNTDNYFRQYAEPIVTETRGQWIPTFDPNKPDGQHISLRKLNDGDTLRDLQIPVERASEIPDGMHEQLLAIDDAKEMTEEAATKLYDEYERTSLDKTPEPINVVAEIEQYADAPDPYVEFQKNFPRIRSNEDFVGRIAYLRDKGSTEVTDEQAKTFTEITDAFDVRMGVPKGTFISHINFTDEFPREMGGLYQKINIDTPEFHAFFDGSKAVAEDGSPLVVYHGTPSSGFDTFDMDRVFVGGDGPGLYFTDSPELASQYAEDFRTGVTEEDATPGIHPVYLSIKNPFPLEGNIPAKKVAEIRARIGSSTTTTGDVNWLDLIHEIEDAVGSDDIHRVMAESGYDGVISKGRFGSGKGQYVVFDPGQAKSAIANRGTWDRSNPNMLFQTADSGFTRTGWLTDEERQAMFDEGLREGKPLANEMVDRTFGEPVKEGYTRLYRGEYQGSKIAELPYWLKEARAANGITAAEGRWFTDKPEIADWYVKEAMPAGGRSYIDIPTADLEAYRVSNLAPGIKNFSRDAENEFFVPRELADQKQRIYATTEGRVDANGTPLFQTGVEGQALWLQKLLTDKEGPFSMIGAFKGSRVDGLIEEMAHTMSTFLQTPEGAFGEMDKPMRAAFQKDLDIIAEAAGAPKIQSKTGKPQYVMFLKSWKLDEAKMGAEEVARVSEGARLAEERFAEWVKKYVATGKAPTKKLQEVFDRFKTWLVGLVKDRYTAGDKIPIRVKMVIDNWLTDTPELAGELDSMKRAVTSYAKAKDVDAFKTSANTLLDRLEEVNDGPLIKQFRTRVDDIAEKLSNPTSAKLSQAKAAKSEALGSIMDRWEKMLDDVEDVDPTDEAVEIFKNISNGKLKLKTISDDIEKRLGDIASEEDQRKALSIKSTLLYYGQALGLRYQSADEETRLAIDSIVDAARRDSGFSWAAADFDILSHPQNIAEIEQKTSVLIEEGRKLGYEFKTINDVRTASADFELGEGLVDKSETNITNLMDGFWNDFANAIKDGEYPLPIKDEATGVWVKPSNEAQYGELIRGRYKPPKTLNQVLMEEQGAAMSEAERAAMQSAGTVYIPPEVQTVLKSQEEIQDYFVNWYAQIEQAVQQGHLPPTDPVNMTADASEKALSWLEGKYSQVSDAAWQAQNEAKQKMNTVMMDFSTTLNLDVLMQQGPTVMGLKPLAFGGIVPFFKFPRMNIESWMNTLASNPYILHNFARYNEMANRERKQYGMSEQFLPSYPVQISGQVMTVSPFGFISLSQLLRPISPYSSESADDMTNAISVAQQAGFSLGPVTRFAVKFLGIAPSMQMQGIVPQGAALIDPNSAIGQSLLSGGQEFAKLIGLASDDDENRISQQIVQDGLGDMRNATPKQREEIYYDLISALNTRTSARRTQAEQHYRDKKFQQQNMGYWTGIYGLPMTSGEQSRAQYKQDVAEMQAAMSAVGLTAEQTDKLNKQMLSDPRRAANTAYSKLFSDFTDVDPTAKNREQSQANEEDRQGQLHAYYSEVGLLQAKYQQEYGMSGTPIPDEVQQEFFTELNKLNAQYADALTPRKVERYEGQTEQDLQYQLGRTWLEYLKDSKPVYAAYKTYAEYKRATDEWYKTLGKSSQQMWQFASSLIGSSDDVPPYLTAISNEAAMKKFESQYDTSSDAIYKVYSDKYYSGYWDAVNAAKDPYRRGLADATYKQTHPVPTNQQIIDWVRADEVYAKRFTNQDLLRELTLHPVADIQQRYQTGMTLQEMQAVELSNMLSRIPPGNAYFKFLDSMDKDTQELLKAYQLNGYKPLNSKYWVTAYNSVKSAVSGMFSEPDIKTRTEWVKAYDENELMTATRDRLAPGFADTYAEYTAIDYADKATRTAYRRAHPEIGQYYDWLYNTWSPNHPLWQKYYGTAETGTTTTTSQKETSTYVPGVTYKRSSGGSGGSGWKNYGSSYSSSYSSGTPAASPQSYDKNWQPWQDFRRMAGDALLGKLNDYWNSGAALSEQETGLLQTLFKQYPFGAKSYDEWLKTVLPGLQARFIPGHDFFKNPTYYSDVYPIKHYNDNPYWFDKGKKAM